MRTNTTLLFTLLAISAVGCTTISPQTTVVTQAIAGGNGTAVAVIGAPARPLTLPTGEFFPLESWNVVLVTAKSVERVGEVREINDSFTFEGRIFAHATFAARPGVHGGQPNVEVRWLNADRLVSVQRARPLVNKSPYYMASSTSGTALGAGNCKVEYRVNGKLVAVKEFIVSRN